MGNGRSRIDNRWESSNLRQMPPKEFGTCLMLGVFEWGSDDVMIHTSFDDFKLKRGGFLSNYAAALQAYCYFAMGGTKLITKRVFHYTDPTAATPVLTTAAKGTYMLVTANGAYGVQNTLRIDGLYYGDLALTVQALAATNGSTSSFDLKVFHPRETQAVEHFRNITMDTTSIDYAEDVINDSARKSNYISVTDQSASGTVAQRNPAAMGSAAALTGGNAGLASLVDADYVGGPAGRVGLYGFQLVNEGNILLVPDGLSSTVQNAAIAYCQSIDYKQEKLIYIPEVQASLTYLNAVAQQVALTNSRARTGLYWPRVQIANPDKAVYGYNNDEVTVGYGGILAGLIAGQSKKYQAQMAVNPSNEVFGWMGNFVVGLEGSGVKHEVVDPKVRDYVTDYGVNPIMTGRRDTDGQFGCWFDDCQTGEVVGQTEISSVGNQMLTSHLRYRYEAYLQRHRTQGNSKARRTQIKGALDSDLKYWTSLGCFASQNASQAFYVNTDPEALNINNPLIQRQQKLVCKIGLAYADPARFIDLYFTRDNRAVESFMAQGAAAAGATAL